MVHYPNTYTPAAPSQTMNGRPLSQMDWTAEITMDQPGQTHPASDTGLGGMDSMPGSMVDTSRDMAGITGTAPEMQGGMAGAMQSPGRQMIQNGGAPQMQRTGLSSEVIENPLTVDEAYKGSLKAMLSRYIGSYVVATFLVGTQGTVSWEGTLFDVGNDFVTIYQEPRDRYIVSDLYSLKYIEFYDTRRREMCEAILQQNGWQNNN